MASGKRHERAYISVVIVGARSSRQPAEFPSFLTTEGRIVARGGRNNEDSLMQDSASAGAYAHQLGNLNHRRGISNSTDYVLITRRFAGNVE